MNEFITVDAVEKKCVAIVKFGPAGSVTDGFRAGEYFQVTIDPDRASPSGEFIRFGVEHNTARGMGDEIQGWQRCKAISVVEILGDWDGEEPPILKYGTTNGITETA